MIRTLAAGLLAGALVTAAGCGGTAASGCQIGQLRLTIEPPISEPTGRHTAAVTLENVSPATCMLRGYPTVALLDARGAALPFRYVRTRRVHALPIPEGRVVLRPGDHAIVLLDKYRCDIRTVAPARTIDLSLPGAWAPRSVALTGEAASLDWCGEEPSRDVLVSPFAPSG